jgi:cytochrome P450
MPVAMLIIDAGVVLTSLKISAFIVGGFLLILAFIMPLRLHTVWKATRPARISMACDDPQSLSVRLAKALKPVGYKPSGVSGGPFTMEPPDWRRKFGAAAVAVEFPSPRTAVITGQRAYLARIARTYRVALMPAEGGLPFGAWVKPKMMPLLWIAAILFIAVFFVLLFTLPAQSL